jgi:replication factor A1
MRESEVIAQFPIVEEFLLNRSNQLRKFMETDRIRRYLLKKARTATANSIKDLRTGMSHVNLKAKILEVAEPKHVVTRYGNHASVAKALIADETGTIKLCLWNGQIASVSAGDTVQIENAQVSTFRGERHVSLGKKGTLSNIEIFKPQVTSIDLSTPRL